MANITVDEVRKAQRAEGPATIMAIGTANPANCVDQSTYPDFYFRITNSDHMTELKRKFQRMSKLELKEEKLRASRHVLAEYGNMSSACVLFILDEMRKKSAADGCATTGEGLDWGVLFGFGPGLTVETVVLHSVAL
ncbi:unnamed protein product [Linum tenue]|uniref:Chalcone/stilbene synthase C-terminal domain-containing protein n=1 Tax=Linum tenue TaxID=586396 RepID=A0AAV0LRJ4_9ROSI|nr:unnamed protein product [Linum tenue]